ncbi:DUF397 domain-containing protein [Streptomyces sp. NBC_01591]|uniref:DUF397 domain-containing protein n=1 Tax=Streptomyces sp. NBC_01591 TaxID=2975888 RepID=UPI002DDACA8A|nr:DUF397 domain-containing protein [Streptomyces sp. NBC_01591]WSD69791.1 DUF397 domain-containing protein [Streptomyces sp. NBC_01591]
MPTSPWQKSSYCGEGDACIHISTSPGRTVRLTESGDPSGAVLRTTPTAWAALVRTIKESRSLD